MEAKRNTRKTNKINLQQLQGYTEVGNKIQEEQDPKELRKNVPDDKLDESKTSQVESIDYQHLMYFNTGQKWSETFCKVWLNLIEVAYTD